MSQSVILTFQLPTSATSEIPTEIPSNDTVAAVDAIWILLCAFIIFTMQTGFGFLEAGCVSTKNEVNIMMKNAVDIILGGITYWIFGYGITFGNDAGSSSFFGLGWYAVDANQNDMGNVFQSFVFQLSFSTTATTIVSGSMAERCSFPAYCIFSFLNTFIYCVPARWIWYHDGWLAKMGVIDFAGSGVVHLLGAVSGFVGAWMIGPRLGRYDNGTKSLPLGNPSSCIIGMFILWFGWLAFNAGSTFGMTGGKWAFASRAAATTMVASVAGGTIGILYGFIKPQHKVEVMDIVNTVLASLVGITAGCALVRTSDAFIIGVISAAIEIITAPFTDKIRVDDPVGATSVHGFVGIFGLLSVGFFAEDDPVLGLTNGNAGVFHGGSFYLLGVQTLAAICIIVWTAFTTFIVLWVINKIIPLRMSVEEELLGADFSEHLIRRRSLSLTLAISVFSSHPEIAELETHAGHCIGTNPIHENMIQTLHDLHSGSKRARRRESKGQMKTLKRRYCPCLSSMSSRLLKRKSSTEPLTVVENQSTTQDVINSLVTSHIKENSSSDPIFTIRNEPTPIQLEDEQPANTQLGEIYRQTCQLDILVNTRF